MLTIYLSDTSSNEEACNVVTMGLSYHLTATFNVIEPCVKWKACSDCFVEAGEITFFVSSFCGSLLDQWGRGKAAFL